MPHVNGLSHAETERIAKLIEECGELQQILAKTLIHGWASTHPRTGLSNTDRVHEEAGDVMGAVKRMILAGDLDGRRLVARGTQKMDDNTHLHYQDGEDGQE